MNYFSFHVGDYSAHTAHLEPLEDLAYRRALDAYYLKESPLPRDPSEVARLIRMRSHVAEVEQILREFFTLGADGWVNKRADEEIAKMRDKQTKARQSGLASAAARSFNDRSTTVQRTLNDRSTDVQLPTPTPTPIPEEKKEIKTSPTPAGVVPLAEKPAKQPRAAKQQPERPDDVTEQTWADWLALRASKRAPVTRTVLAGAVAEAVKARMTTEEFLQAWCRRGSQGLEAAWLRQDDRQQGQPLSFAERAHNAAVARVHEMTGGLAAAKPIGINQPEFIDADPFRARPIYRGQPLHSPASPLRLAVDGEVDGG